MAPKPDSDLLQTFWVLLSTGGNAGLGLLGSLALVVWLTPAQYGLFSSVVAVSIVGQEILGRGINDSVLRLGTQAVSGTRRSSLEIFRAGFLIKLILCLVIWLLFISFSRTLFAALGRPEMNAVRWAILMTIVGSAFFTLVVTRRQANLEFGTLALIRPAINLVKVLFFAVVMYMGMLSWGSAVWITAVSTAGAAVLIGAGDWKEIFRLPWDTGSVMRDMVRVWRYGCWNTIATVSFVACSRMDILMLTRLLEESDVAVYNVAWQILSVIDLCTISIMTTMIPKVCHIVDRGALKGWIARSLKLSLGLAVMAMPLIFLADWLVPRLPHTNYLDSLSLLKIMFPGYILTMLIFPLVGVLYAREKFSRLAVINTSLFCLSVPVYYWGIRLWGTTGAAWGTFVLKVIIAVVMGAEIWVTLKRSPDGGGSKRLQTNFESEVGAA